MRVAFIGAGGMASGLIGCVEAYDDAEIAAICDIDEGAAREAAAPHEAAVYTDHETLFSEHEFDTVFIAIPPFAYSNQVELATEHDVNVFIEKPVGLRPADARENEALVKNAECVTSSGYVFRYDEITERALELISDRELSLIDGCYWSGLLVNDWGNEMEISGGEINVRSTHVYDLLRLFAGEATRVSAVGSNRADIDAIDYPDATAAVVEHENGIVSTVSSSVTVPEWTVDLSLVGEDFKLDLDYTTQRITGVIDEEPINFVGECDRYCREVTAFLDAAASGKQGMVRSSYEDAVRTLELNWAVIEAAESDESVEL